MKNISKVVLLPVITIVAVSLSYNTWAGDGVKSGAVIPEQRFSVGTGAETDCVIDSLTKLMWVKSPPISIMNWADASAYAGSLTLCGYSDWRLPSLNELEGLLKAAPSQGGPSPADFLNSQGFSNVQDYYWSSDASVDFPACCTRAVNMKDRRLVSHSDRQRHKHSVWSVRNMQ